MTGSDSAHLANDDGLRAIPDFAATQHDDASVDAPLRPGGAPSPIKPAASPLDLEASRLNEIMFSNSPFAKIMVAADGRIVDWNKASETLLGYRKEEITGQHVRVLMPGLTWPDYDRGVLKLKTKKSLTIGSVRRHKDGALIDVNVTATCIETSDGVFHGVLSTLIDTRQRTRETEENARLATIIRTSPLAVVSVDTDRKVRTWNAAAESMFGYSGEEIFGQHLEAIVPTRLRDESAAYANKIGETEKVDWNTLRLARDGREIPVNVIGRPTKTTGGIPTGWALFYRDISDRLAAQRALKDSEEFTRSILAASLDWIAVVDGTGGVVYSNRVLGSVGRGDPSAAPSGMTLETLWPNEAVQVLSAGITTAIRVGASRVTASRRPDGDIRRWYDIAIIRLPKGDSNADRLLIKASDITDKKAQENHIAIIIKELSHRAKNLLAVITAMARCTILQSHNFEHFEAAFCARIHGLSRSHDLLVQQDWMGVMVFDLARQQLQPFMDVGGDRLSLTGANIYVPPALAQVIGMALHELATNAVKYGALATPTGHLSIACESIADGYRLRWTESGEIGRAHV